jgi:hypothetical protein
MSSLAVSSITPTTPMELVYAPKERPVVRQVVAFLQGYQGPASFSEDYAHIEAAMKLTGIPISLDERKEYPSLKEGQLNIYLSDANFGKAFYKIYFKNNLDPDKFQWRMLKA